LRGFFVFPPNHTRHQSAPHDSSSCEATSAPRVRTDIAIPRTAIGAVVTGASRSTTYTLECDWRQLVALTLHCCRCRRRWLEDCGQTASGGGRRACSQSSLKTARICDQADEDRRPRINGQTRAISSEMGIRGCHLPVSQLSGPDAISARKHVGFAALRIGCLAVCLLQTGCRSPSVEPVPDRSAIPLRSSFAAIATAHHARVDPVLPDWVKAFGDDRLSEVVEEAVAQNWLLSGAQERLEQSRLLASRAGSALTPAIDAVAGASRSDPGGDATSRTSLRVGLAASWELDVWGRIRAAESGERFDARAVEADYASLTEAIAAQAAQAGSRGRRRCPADRCQCGKGRCDGV